MFTVKLLYSYMRHLYQLIDYINWLTRFHKNKQLFFNLLHSYNSICPNFSYLDIFMIRWWWINSWCKQLIGLIVKSKLKYFGFHLHIMETLSLNDNWKYSQWVITAAFHHLYIGFLIYFSSELSAISAKSSQLFNQSSLLYF